MTIPNLAAARREISYALHKALEHRHAVLDVIMEADDGPAAANAIVATLGISRQGAEAVMQMSFDQLTKNSRREIAAELDDLNSQLSFTLHEQPVSGSHNERPARSSGSLVLRAFVGEADRQIFAARTQDIGTPGHGSDGPVGALDDEIRAALSRIDAEQAAWFVAIEGMRKVGMVFGELDGGEVNVRIWIHPEYRSQGYGTAALRKCGPAMARYFPSVPLVIRAPGARPT
jgi:GNAT superfamily N-acetyltransferase